MKSTMFIMAALLGGSIALGASSAQAIYFGDPDFDFDSEVSRLLDEGYTMVELEPRLDDPRREDIFNRFVRPDYERAGALEFLPPLSALKFAFHDLDGDGHEELVINSGANCNEIDGCALFIYSSADGSSWSRILGVYGEVVAFPSSGNGDFPPLTVLSPKFDHFYEFDGASYQEVMRD